MADYRTDGGHSVHMESIHEIPPMLFDGHSASDI